MTKKRKLLSGKEVPQLDRVANLSIITKCPEKWKIVEVVANGLRLVKSLRKSLLPEIEEKGIESVINRLESEA